MRLTLLLVALAALQLFAADAPKADAKPVVLLTGFEPFGGAKINESWETVKTFQGKEINGYTIQTALLPVIYDEMDAPLKQAIAKHKPDIVISFGVGTRVIQIETLARNGYHPMKPADNKDKAPPREKIIPDGKDTIPTELPTEKIVAALKEAKIGVTTSTDAGGYLCNECFYRLMSLKDGPPVRGFIHVPPYKVKDPAGGVFDAEKLQRAVQTIVETVTKK
ncbi:MAG TPA: pyroglutamyl-peptidase I [Planctomycetota bacterium]|nr:pyroglutamyl-peptidase I [Planctomycetota bacterium]